MLVFYSYNELNSVLCCYVILTSLLTYTGLYYIDNITNFIVIVIIGVSSIKLSKQLF